MYQGIPDEMSEDMDDDSEYNDPRRSKYAFCRDRNFGYEVQEYIQMKREIRKRK